MNILNIFYNNIINEARNGDIDSFFHFNILFRTEIVEKNIILDTKSDFDNLLVPTLKISRKEEFDRLLIEYVTLAMDFYSDDNFPSEILNNKMYDEEKRICKEKMIIASLFANFSIEDFNNPCEYLKRRIDFFKNTCEKDIDIGYSNILKGELSARIEKDKIYNECPYQFSISAKDEQDVNYIFPSIKFGISEDKVYIYAIQNGKDKDNSKRINRALYKIGEGFDSAVDNFDIFGSGNLKDVTSSFLVALNIFIAYMYSTGIKKIVVPSILIERWNAKELANNKKKNFGIINEDKFKEKEEEHEDIQRNLTEKLLRTFLRLKAHYSNIDILNYPMEDDTSLQLEVENMENCNNSLLEETSNLVFEQSKKILRWNLK